MSRPCPSDATTRHPSPEIIRSVIKRYEHALDYHIYCRVDKSPMYDENVAENIEKWAKRLQTQIRSHMFGAFDVISVTSFLPAFKLARDTSEIHDGAAIWFLHFFTKRSPAAASNARSSLKQTSSSNTHRAKERMLRKYRDVVHSLLQTYDTNDVIADADVALTRYVQPSTISAAQLWKALVTSLLRCGEVYDDYVRKEIFIKGLHKSVGHSMRLY